MAGQQKQRHLSAIVFTDIVGYSAIVNRDEALGARLLDRQREVVRRVVPRHGGREIETAGDSFLLEFGSTLAAVEAVLALQQELSLINAGAPAGERVVLRASVHLGDIEHRGKEVYGDGVNVAARLLPLSPEGGLALSAPVLASVRQRLPLPARSIGTPALKNIETPVEVFVVDLAQPVAGPAPPESPARGPIPRLRWAVPLGLAVLVGVATAYLALRSKPVAALDKSVAVLPFTNMSTDASNAYFADGMQDQVLTNLSRIRDLKVISRTSVERYRGQSHDLRSIARELDVATVVEGSVQRVGDRVRITVQLIDAATDAHLWAESYDRDLADVFAVQSEIASKIADSLRATLAPAEVQAIAALSSQNRKAYDLYLRALGLARNFLDENQWDERAVPEAISLLEQSVKEDPGFALGWAELARLEMYTYWLSTAINANPGRLERARAAAERALALQPNLGEAHHAMALYHYWGRLDYEQARREIGLAQATLGSADIAVTAGAITRREGRFDDALVQFQRAAELDPKRAASWQNLGYTQLMLGRLDEARANLDRSVALSANPGLARVQVSGIWMRASGNLDGWREAIEALRPGSKERADVAGGEFYLRLLRREFELAQRVLDTVPGPWLDGQPVAELEGFLALARGEREAALKAFSRARGLLETAAADGNAYLLGDLGIVYAALGQREQAVAAGQRSVDLSAKDILEGPFTTQILALIYVLLGDKEQALTRLEEFQQRLGRLPCGGCFLAPMWDPLRDEPRFQRVQAALAGTRPA